MLKIHENTCRGCESARIEVGRLLKIHENTCRGCERIEAVRLLEEAMKMLVEAVRVRVKRP